MLVLHYDHIWPWVSILCDANLYLDVRVKPILHAFVVEENSVVGSRTADIKTIHVVAEESALHIHSSRNLNKAFEVLLPSQLTSNNSAEVEHI